MSIFSLSFCLLVVATVEGGSARKSRRIQAQSLNCGCQCSPLTLQDKYGTITGNCLSSYKGSKWCYVDSWDSSCTDLRKSSKTSKPWSYQACVTPTKKSCKAVKPVVPEVNDEIPFPPIECRPGEEHLPGDEYCCRKISDHSFIYCT